jgi:hypothetical protein
MSSGDGESELQLSESVFLTKLYKALTEENENLKSFSDAKLQRFKKFCLRDNPWWLNSASSDKRRDESAPNTATCASTDIVIGSPIKENEFIWNTKKKLDKNSPIMQRVVTNLINSLFQEYGIENVVKFKKFDLRKCAEEAVTYKCVAIH